MYKRTLFNILNEMPTEPGTYNVFSQNNGAHYKRDISHTITSRAMQNDIFYLVEINGNESTETDAGQPSEGGGSLQDEDPERDSLLHEGRVIHDTDYGGLIGSKSHSGSL